MQDSFGMVRSVAGFVCWRHVFRPVVFMVFVDVVRGDLERVCEGFVAKETNLAGQQVHD
jgi:hypothetical protein